jgi:hypothetical protein
MDAPELIEHFFSPSRLASEAFLVLRLWQGQAALPTIYGFSLRSPIAPDVNVTFIRGNPEAPRWGSSATFWASEWVEFR